MAAVVTLFANISDSVRNRRATIEMSSQVRQVRNMLQQDLLGATCPGLTWQRPEANHGYIELIEGRYRDSFPSMLADGNLDSDGNGNPDVDMDGQADLDELDPQMSQIPRNNNAPDTNGNGQIDSEELAAHLATQQSISGLSGLGDYDDTLMFTSRNEHEPFVGRVPGPKMTERSSLAEVIWFAVENPTQAENNVVQGFFGEPGMRTIYRRVLLIAPWIDLGNGPGVLEPLGMARNEIDRAVAALIRFQDIFDLSARVEWDPFANSGAGQWKVIANTLADLTKRENRFGHYGFVEGGTTRMYPFAVASVGSGYSSSQTVTLMTETGATNDAQVTANANSGAIVSYTVTSKGSGGTPRPFAYVTGTSGARATANAMLNDKGEVVRVLHGPAPLWGPRRGEDVMLTDVLAFDLRVYDPGAPIYQETATKSVLEPSDPGWQTHYNATLGMVTGSASFVGQGAYVDMGYAFGAALPIAPPGTPWIAPWFAEARPLFNVRIAAGSIPLPSACHLAPGFAVYDTWSLSYENNGIDDDGDGIVDEGTNGLDDDLAMGPDDVGERETAPPYDVPLRGVQVLIRVYERDARQIRQVRVNQHFLTE
jgi:hypothetical protein